MLQGVVPFDEAECLRLLERLCFALKALHARRVRHADIKVGVFVLESFWPGI